MLGVQEVVNKGVLMLKQECFKTNISTSHEAKQEEVGILPWV